MRRLASIATNETWKRLGLQLGLLGGVGLAFAVTQQPEATANTGLCRGEDQCSFKKPNFMIILDYSASMNNAFTGSSGTRWDAAVQAITDLVNFQNGYFDENSHIGLMRFGHDPNPGQTGTTITDDVNSGNQYAIVDGVAVDVPWYDPNGTDPWYECQGSEIITALNTAGPPAGGATSGIGTYTQGAMRELDTLITAADNDHPQDGGIGLPNGRYYASIVITDGEWTGPDGIANNATNADDPGIEAAALLTRNVPTYVVALDLTQGSTGLQKADDLAADGGTTEAVEATSPQVLTAELQQIVQDIQSQVVIPECTAGLPRVMIVLDASSSMLNTGSAGTGAAATQGNSSWDRAYEALAGNMSLFDLQLQSGNAVEDLVHLGVTVFGLSGEESVLIDYGPCMKDNFAWALDPNTSCDAPGCTDPWSGPPITWTFKDGSAVGPMFDQSTLSHMPACDPSTTYPGACTGSGTETHLGLELVATNQAAYASAAAMPGALYPADGNTQYVNILITDGEYNSTNTQVQNALEGLYASGIETYVIGFGDPVQSGNMQVLNKLAAMACWGQGGVANTGGATWTCDDPNKDYFTANTSADLQQAIADILNNITFDPCCAFNDCSQNPEPTTNEPDPMTSTSGDGDGDGGSASGGDGGSASGGDSAGDDMGFGEDDTTGGFGVGTEDDGCSCSAPADERSNGRGMLGSLVLLGAAGLFRRRRRRHE